MYNLSAPKKNEAKHFRFSFLRVNRSVLILIPILASTLLLFTTWQVVVEASNPNSGGLKHRYSSLKKTPKREATSLNDSVHVTEIILHPGPEEGIDTQIDGAYPDKFYGDEPYLTIGFRSSYPDYLGGPYRILLKFDMSSVPTDRRIISAVMEVYIQEYNIWNSFELYRATSDWDEATTWNTQPTYDDSRIWYSFQSDDYREWVKRAVLVTEIFQGWQDGTYSNYGFYIKGVQESVDGTRNFLASSDNPTLSLRPKVTIEVPAPHTVSVSPEGSGVGLIVSEPGGYWCKDPEINTCISNIDTGVVLTFTAYADPGSFFTGWEGPCSGRGICTLTITESTHIIGKFSNQTTDLILQPGPGEGIDTYIDQTNPKTSFGDEEILAIGNNPYFGDPGGPYRSLLKIRSFSYPKGCSHLECCYGSAYQGH